MASEIVGREEELAALHRFLDGEDNGPRALVLEGEAGIGKSTLWLAGVESARDRGVSILSSRPAQAERGLAFAGLGDLLEGIVDEVLRALSPPRRRALEVALLMEEASEPADPRALGVAVRNALEILAAEAPLVVAIDDVQWLDRPSGRALSFALRRLEGSVVLVLARRLDHGIGPSEIERAFAPGAVQRLEVGPLSVGAIQRLLRERLERAFPRPTLLRIHEASGGNPLYALELARALGPDVDPRKPLHVPETLEGLVGARLATLPEATRAALVVVSAVGSPSPDLLRSLGLVENRLEPALANKVVEWRDAALRFTHPLLESVVYQDASTDERRHVHARLAEAVDDPLERARHLALAVEGPSSGAADTLEAAAATALHRGAAVVAAELAEQALRLTPESDVEGVGRRTLLVAELLVEAGDSRRALALLERMQDTVAPGRERAAFLLGLAGATSAVHGARKAFLLCQRALPEAAGDDELEALIHISLVEEMRFVADPVAIHGLEHAELAVTAATRADDPALKCRALAIFGLQHFLSGRGIPHAEMEEALALERSLGGSMTAATWTLGHQLAWSGDDLERARAHLHAYREAMRARDSLEEGHALHWLTLLEWRAGNWELAARYAADQQALYAQTEEEGQMPVVASGAIRVAAYRGQIAEARDRSERMLERAGELGVRVAEAHYLWMLGFLELSEDDAPAALPNLLRGWEIWDELGSFEPGHRLALADTLEALIAAGELDRAERLIGPWEERCRALGRVWAIAILARCRALLLAARGDLGASLAAFEEALAAHERSVYPFEHARTLLTLGMTQRRAKRRSEARATLEQGLAIFERLGAPLWARKASAELERISGRAASRGELTPAERRVATLVAKGRTNREVAAALYLGERTVASHLTRIYAKLGIRSRTELAHRLR